MCHTDVPAGQTAPKVNSEEVTVPAANGEEMPCLLATGSTGNGAGVVVVPDMFGRSPFYEHLTALLADAGYAVLLVDYFFRQDELTEAGPGPAMARRGQLDETQSVEDIDKARTWLATRTEDRVGVVGFCMGGTFVLDLASQGADIAGVAYYGFPVPQAALKQPPPRPIDLVDHLQGPVLAFWGDQDETVGLDNAKDYIERANKVNPQFESEILPGLAHGFLGNADLTDSADAGGKTWARTLEFLSTNLGAN